MSEKKPKETEYLDPEGKKQTGWYLDGHVYRDEAATEPIAVGSTVRMGNGKTYRMTPYGGVLWAAPKQEDSAGNWVPQGNPWYRAAQDAAYRLQNRPDFSYDPRQDPLYQGARNQYLLQGRRAMEDTLGRVSGLTGGYASTYAQALGAQAYQASLDKLAALLPDYYDRARDAYAQEGKALRDELGAAIGLYDQEYQTYLDRQAALERQQAAQREESHWTQENDRKERELAARLDQWEQDFAEDRRRWEAETFEEQRRYDAKAEEDRRRWEAEQQRADARTREEQQRYEARTQQERQRSEEEQRRYEAEQAESRRRWDLEFAQALREYEDRLEKDQTQRSDSDAATERSYAYRMAMLALQQGLRVSDALLQAAGIDKAYAESLRRYYAGLG